MAYPDYLPNLDHAVDATLVATSTLTRAALARAIETRRRQIVHVRRGLRDQERTASRPEAVGVADIGLAYNNIHDAKVADPDWSFGQCLDAILAAPHRGAGRSEVLS